MIRGKNMNAQETSPALRLSDRILSALELALDQQDPLIAEHLVRSLELAMTRNAGGADFKEKRDFPPGVAAALDRFNNLKRT